jgi:hypothetical protein
MRQPGPPLELLPEDERDIERTLRDMIERDESVAARFERIMCRPAIFVNGTVRGSDDAPTSPPGMNGGIG